MRSQEPGTFWEGIGGDGKSYHGGLTRLAYGWSTGVPPALTNFTYKGDDCQYYTPLFIWAISANSMVKFTLAMTRDEEEQNGGVQNNQEYANNDFISA
jgi:hypothetical protein